jgi:hypothetical protein
VAVKVRLGGSFDSGQHSVRATKNAVLVLGMHRSGTSSIAGALVSLGGGVPLHLLPPQPDNEKGFWESSVLTELNDEILVAGGSNWKDWRAFDLGRIDSKAAVALQVRAKAALASEFGDASLPIVKDPRMCRLMRFWAPVFEEAEWSVRAVLPMRSPLEVARSLHRRDGLSVSWACLLWLRHVLDAEAESRAIPRAVVDWSRFLDDMRGALAQVTKQLQLTWPNGGESAFADVDELVSPGLRHHTASEADLNTHPAISDLIRETSSAMLELIAEPKNNVVLRKLDDLRARFENATGIFGHAVQELEEELHTVKSRAEEGDALAAQLLAGRDSAQLRELAFQLSAAKSEVDLVSGRILAANEQIAHAEATIAYISSRYAEKNGAWRSLFLFRSLWKARSSRLKALSLSPGDLETIRNSLFFDENHYLEENTDVRKSGTDAALHYLLYGGLEGRDPGPFFSTEAYVARYPDIAAAGLNPLLHYEQHGRRENRRVLPGLDQVPAAPPRKPS